MGSDNYPTPAWCTKRILEALAPMPSDGLRKPLFGALCVEPCAGEGAISNVLRDMGALSVLDYDIRPVGKCAIWDATAPLPAGTQSDLLITNPPFSLAADIIIAQRDTARVCAYLLRSSFKLEGVLNDGSSKQYGAKQVGTSYSFRGDMPDIYQLPERPSFIASDRCAGGDLQDGASGVIHALPCDWAQKVPIDEAKPKVCPHCAMNVKRSTSDASEYSWFVWTTERLSVGSIRLLPSTPIEERSAKAAARAAKRAAR